MNTTRWILVFLICFLGSTNPSPAQWSQFSNLGGRRVFSLAASGSNLFAGTDLGVFLSTNGGVSWTPRNAGLPNLVVTSLVWNGPRIFAAMDQWVYRSADTGVTWTLSNNGLTASSISSLALKDTILFVSGFGGVFRSTDKGTNWTAVNVGLTLDLVACFAVQNNYLFAAGEKGFFRSSNDGTSWTALDIGLTSGNYVRAFATTGTYLFAGTDAAGIYVSTDDGQHWMTANRGLVGVRVITFGVYQQTTVHQTIVARTDAGLFFSEKDGGTWISFLQGLPYYYYPINTFLVCGTNLLAGTDHGVWGRPLAELAVGVESRSNEIPAGFALDQNYPNPFNPSTTIRYQVPKASSVSLRILNTLGQEVAVLVDEEKGAGYYQVRWDAAHPSGVYLYRLQAGEYRETKRMILLR